MFHPQDYQKQSTVAQDNVLSPSHSLTEPEELQEWFSLCKTMGHHLKGSLRSQVHEDTYSILSWYPLLRTWGPQKPLGNCSCSCLFEKRDRSFDKRGSKMNRAHNTVRCSLFNLLAIKANVRKSSTQLPENKWEKGDAWLNPTTLLFT